MSGHSALEVLDSFIEVAQDFLQELQEKKAELVQVEKCRSELASLNSTIGVKQQQLAEPENHIKLLLSKLHLRAA